MDNISIRGHIIENFKNNSLEEIRGAIVESVKEEKDEELLPGMGVFFSILWEEADDELKEKITTLVKDGIDKRN